MFKGEEDYNMLTPKTFKNYYICRTIPKHHELSTMMEATRRMK